MNGRTTSYSSNIDMKHEKLCKKGYWKSINIECPTYVHNLMQQHSEL